MKAVLITGAARRIGAAIARSMAADRWHVVLHYARSGEAAQQLRLEIEAAGGSASLLAADLTNESQQETLIDAARACAPGLEMLVNNASAFLFDTAQTTTGGALFDSFAVNACAPIILAQRFAETLPAGQHGQVVNILDNRIFAPNPDYFSYGVSKFALLGATRMLALGLAPRVRVNGIAPGITLVSGEQTAQGFATAHRLNPLQRGCTPEEIAGAVRFIAATPSMTGEILTLDGGQTLANPGRDVAFIDPTSTSSKE